MKSCIKVVINKGMGDEVLSITWKKASNTKEAFMREYLWQHREKQTLSVNIKADT